MMPDDFQPGPHLSPDELSAFAENVLPEHERLAALTHLADCPDCRKTLFLAQQADPSLAVPKPFVPTPRRAWFTLPQLFVAAGAALACTLILALIVHLRSDQSPPPPVTTAKVEPQQPIVPPALTPAPAPQKAVPAQPSAGLVQLSAAAAHSPAAPQVSDAEAPPPLPKLDTPQPASRSLGAVGSGSGMSTGMNYGRATESKAQDKTYFNADSNASASAYAAVPSAAMPPKTPPAIHGGMAMPAPAPPEDRMRQSSVASNDARQEKDFSVVTTGASAAAPAQPPAAAANTGELAANMDSISDQNLQLADRTTLKRTLLKLPSKKPVASSLVAAGRTLALDTAGALFLSNDAGKHWTAVAAQWSGKAVQLSFALSPARRYLNQPQANQTQVPTQSNGYLNNGAESNGVAGNAAPPQQQTIAPTAGFQLTTADGVVWLSTDGLTWHPR